MNDVNTPQQAIDTGNGLPEEPLTPEQIKANRIELVKSQQAETNLAFDPQTGFPVAPANEPPQDPLQEILQQQTPPVVTNTPPIPAAVPPVPQPPVQPPVQPIAPQPEVQPPADPNPVQQQLQGEEPQSDLLPEEQVVVDRLNTLMSEIQPGTQEQPPVDPTLAALLQQNQILMAQNQQLQANQQQQAFAPQPPQADPFGANPAFQWGDPNQQGLPPAPLAPAPPMQPQGVDANQALLGSAVHQLSQQVTQIQQNNTAFQASQIRDQEIQSLMQTNGISRQHAERAIEYNENGNLQAAAEVINLASAPVIARQMQTHEREVRRDAAGQSLTPAPQGGVRTTPDEMQAKMAEWTAIQSMPMKTIGQSDLKREAIVAYISRNPEIAAQAQQTPASITPPVV